jgi:hypothetical protein
LGFVVKVDSRGRLRLPGYRGEYSRVVLLDLGSFFVGVPIPKDPLASTSGILDSKKSVVKLKALAERSASSEAYRKARRNRHAG